MRALRVHWAGEMGREGQARGGFENRQPGESDPAPAYAGGPQGDRLDHVCACAMTSQPAQPAHGTRRLLAGQAGSGGLECGVGWRWGVFDAGHRYVLTMTLNSLRIGLISGRPDARKRGHR